MSECNHDWQLIRKRNIFFLKRALWYCQSLWRVWGINIKPESSWYFVYVDWECSKCKDTHTTLHDKRLEISPGKPGQFSWKELNTIWELEFGEKNK